MKKHKVLCTGLCIMLMLSVFAASPITSNAATVVVDHFRFDPATGTITNYYGNDTILDIPSSIDGIPVVGLGYWAINFKDDLTEINIPSSITSISQSFVNCKNLKAIKVEATNPSYKSIDGVLFTKDGSTLMQYPHAKLGAYDVPDGVTHIYNGAFAVCWGLTGISLPPGLTHIGEQAIACCDNLPIISIPASVTSIDFYAFADCEKLTAINVSAANTTYKSIDGALFSDGGRTLLQCPGAKQGAYSVPSCVTNIRNIAFWGCKYLTSVQIPSTVTSIGNIAFKGCANLTEFNVSSLNERFNSIDGVLLFEDNHYIVAYPQAKPGAYVIPDTVTAIGSSVFKECNGLTSVTITRNVELIGSHIFKDCKNLASINILPGLTYISESMFHGCEKLTSVHIPAGVNSIGESAFYGCNNLVNVEMPTSVTSIEENAFSACPNITIKGIEGSYAQTYAKNESIPFIAVEAAYLRSIKYQTHVQNIGWQEWKRNGEVSGTSGKSLRLEGIHIDIEGLSNSIEYRTHVQNIGWQDWASEGKMAGTSGQSLRLEAIEIRLKGEAAKQCDIYYRVHAQNFGWLDWAKNGQSAGSAGYAYRLEAIEIVLVEKGGTVPGTTAVPFRDKNAPAPQDPPDDPDPQFDPPSGGESIKYQTHVQNVGWQGWKRDGEVAGTSGQSLRLEGMYIEIDGADDCIEYRTHVQNIGWQDWVSEGQMTGTSGKSLRLEAIDIRLTGDMAAQYDIYYRVHAQNVGWMDWAKNGQSAGTAGFSYRLEAIQVVLVDKGGSAPGSTAKPFISAY